MRLSVEEPRLRPAVVVKKKKKKKSRTVQCSSSYLGDQRVFRHHLYLNVSYFPAPLNAQIPHVFFFLFLFLLDPSCRPVLILILFRFAGAAAISTTTTLPLPYLCCVPGLLTLGGIPVSLASFLLLDLDTAVFLSSIFFFFFLSLLF